MKYLDQEHNTMSLARICMCTSTLLDMELSALAMMPMHLHRGGVAGGGGQG